jgi:hypothetical protein
MLLLGCLAQSEIEAEIEAELKSAQEEARARTS